jgi:CRP-like cAMP-binding protein
LQGGAGAAIDAGMAIGANAKIELLRGAPLFEQCSKQELQRIARIADELDVPAGKELIREGERGREFFVIVAGEVDVRRKGRKVKTLGPGSFVGEIALLSKIPRVATVTALTPLDVLVITDRAFANLIEKTPSIAVKVARTLADRVGENELSDRRAGKG